MGEPGRRGNTDYFETRGIGMRVLSMGAGVQTTACLIKYHDKYDGVIFADTGNEYPETYFYIRNYLKPFCEAKHIPWHTVTNGRSSSLYKDCFDKKQTPFLRNRQCTREFKLVPIYRLLRKMGAKKNNPITVDIGFSTDEINRLNSSKYAKQYEIKNYPLLHDKLNRNDCKRIITEYGWPLPVKSGCYFCGFQSKAVFAKLKYEHPDLYRKVMEMEKNAGQTVRMNKKKLTDNDSTLDGFCDSGNCFV